MNVELTPHEMTILAIVAGVLGLVVATAIVILAKSPDLDRQAKTTRILFIAAVEGIVLISTILALFYFTV